MREEKEEREKTEMKNFREWRKTGLSAILPAVVLAVMLAGMMTGCGNSDKKEENTSGYPTLDREKLLSDTTDIDDRAAYYDKYVDDPAMDMDEEELQNFFVTVHLKYKHAEAYGSDTIYMLRNDNVLNAAITVSEWDQILIEPGIYRVFSQQLEEVETKWGDAIFGEAELLTPGAEVTMTLDYGDMTISIEE